VGKGLCISRKGFGRDRGWEVNGSVRKKKPLHQRGRKKTMKFAMTLHKLKNVPAVDFLMRELEKKESPSLEEKKKKKTREQGRGGEKKRNSKPEDPRILQPSPGDKQGRCGGERAAPLLQEARSNPTGRKDRSQRMSMFIKRGTKKKKGTKWSFPLKGTTGHEEPRSKGREERKGA